MQTAVIWIADAPILAWVLPGFFLSYLGFFLLPTFLSTSVMQFFQYIPSPDPIGYDLQQTLGFSQSWLSMLHTPYVGTNLYPPLTSALFAPFLALDFAAAYRALTLLTTACYVVMTLAFPVLLRQDRNAISMVLLIFMTGLFSYGLQFELERGQFDVIAVFLAFLAIWLFHYHSRNTFWAYVLFSLAVQLKIYPLIFIPMLIRDWRDWKKNAARILVLAVVNFALLFALGPRVFMDFVRALGGKMASPYIWVGNHSITAFTTLVVQHAVPYGWSGLNQYSGVIQIALLVIVAGCLGFILASSRRRDASGMDVYVLLACTIGSLLIPPTSNDYTLSILAAPVAMLYAEVGLRAEPGKRPPGLLRKQAGLVFVFSAAYASTLFSFVTKPGTFLIANSFLALMVMLVALTVLSALRRLNPEHAAGAELGSLPEATQGPL